MLKLVARFPFWTAIGSVAVAVGLLELIRPTVNGASAAQVLLLVVLLAARFCGSRPALVAAVLAVAAFIRYFLTPSGFAFGEPNDWAALLAFIIIASVGFELAARAERRAEEVADLYAQLQAAFERESEAEAMRRSERLKATLLDAMSHNLRTPLTAIKASVTALLGSHTWRHDAALRGDEQRELLQIIDEESDRLNRFVGGLVTSADGESVQRSTLRPVDIGAVVSKAVARAETLTRDHAIVVSSGDVPPVSVDPSSLTEVIYMLLDNASKYAPPRTTIEIATHRFDEHHVAVVVTDEGPGIPEELRERVFDKFFRIANRESADPSRRGVGLGLPLARRLIQMQGGRVWIETPASGRGASLIVAVPVAPALEGGDREKRPAEHEGDAANRSDGAENRDAGERERVEAS
jgi:two-component system sensor histidine kinase KdpD